MAVDSSLRSIRSLNTATNNLSSSFAKLASGKRINNAKDDPAGSSISAILDAAVVTLSQASRNTSDASSAIQIADSAVQSIGDIRTRQTELAAQSANGTLSDAQRSSIDAEFSALSEEADRIVATTEFNGQKLLQGSSSTTQVGLDSSANSQISTPSVNVSSTAALSSASQASALTALDSLQQSVAGLAQVRGELGATESRLDVARNNISSSKENLAAASSRIQDLDVAAESSRLINNKILQSTSTATLQQSNQSKQNILKLLGS